MLEMLPVIFEVVLIPLLAVLTGYLVAYIKSKTKDLQEATASDKADKYIAIVSEIVSKCVVATNQTYVEALKKEGKFDVAAQEIAFQATLDAVLGLLTDEAKTYLPTVVGDLTLYLTNLIEAEVNYQK